MAQGAGSGGTGAHGCRAITSAAQAQAAMACTQLCGCIQSCGFLPSIHQPWSSALRMAPTQVLPGPQRAPHTRHPRSPKRCEPWRPPHGQSRYQPHCSMGAQGCSSASAFAQGMDRCRPCRARMPGGRDPWRAAGGRAAPHPERWSWGSAKLLMCSHSSGVRKLW